MTIDDIRDIADSKAVQSIMERIEACERKKYTSGIMYWRFQLRMLLDEIEERNNAH